MAEEKVQKVQTLITEPQMVQALISEFSKLEGKPPIKAQLALLIAQNNLETGHRKSMWNWNVGNITHKPGDGFDYWEGLDWLYVSMPNASGFTEEQKKTVKLKYRVYPDLQAGVRDYLSLLKRVKGGSVWKKILEGNPTEFSKALKAANYYTAHEQDTVDPVTGKKTHGYTSGILAGVNGFNKRDSYEQAVNGNVSQAPVAQPQAESAAPSSGATGINKMVEDFIHAVSNYTG